jgi:hypothetical protein
MNSLPVVVPMVTLLCSGKPAVGVVEPGFGGHAFAIGLVKSTKPVKSSVAGRWGPGGVEVPSPEWSEPVKQKDDGGGGTPGGQLVWSVNS